MYTLTMGRNLGRLRYDALAPLSEVLRSFSSLYANSVLFVYARAGVLELNLLRYSWNDIRGTVWNKYRRLPIVYNYPPKGRWIVVDIYQDAKRRGIYPPLFTDPEGDSCFSIYQIRWTKKRFFNFFFWNFRETTRHFSFRSQNSE